MNQSRLYANNSSIFYMESWIKTIPHDSANNKQNMWAGMFYLQIEIPGKTFRRNDSG